MPSESDTHAQPRYVTSVTVCSVFGSKGTLTRHDAHDFLPRSLVAGWGF